MLLTAATLAAVAYCSFQWTVQLVVYRMFAHVPAASFSAYEAAHQRRVSLVVGPLFAGLVLSTGALAVRPGAVDVAVTAGAAAATVILLALTAFGAVPMHRRLTRGYDTTDVRRLLQIDLTRALVASTQSALLVAALLRSGSPA